MTETNLGSNFSWWVGKVVNVKDDPHKSGRVRVRIHGRHDDVGSFPDDSLPWAMPLQPVTSAAIGRIGTSPLGLLPGSHVLGMWADRDQQYPIILGSFGKAGDADGGPVSDGVISVDYAKGGSIPSLSQSNHTLDYNAYSRDAGMTREKYEALYTTGPSPSTPNTKGVKTTEETGKKLHKADAPTVASVDKKDKGGILDHVKQVDPKSVSTVITNAVTNLLPVAAILSATSPAGLTNMMSGSMLGGLTSIAGSFGILPMSNMITEVLGSFDILPEGTFPSGAKSMLMGAFTGVLLASAANGGQPPAPSKPGSSVPTSTSDKPAKSQIVKVAPDGYIKQYYPHGIDPWPGYIVWKSPDGQIEVYTLRNGEPNWASAREQMEYEHAQHASKGFGDILSAGLTGAAAGLAFAALMNNMQSSLSEAGLSSVLGSGINLGSIMSFAPQLLGALGGSALSVVTRQLPVSVLSSGFSEAMNGFVASQAILATSKKSLNATYKKTDDQLDLAAVAAAALFIASFLNSNPGSSPPNIPVRLSNGMIHSTANNLNTTTTTLFIANTIYNL